MMKNAISIVALLATLTLSAQSAGYYNSATGTGYTLKTQLYDIVDGHTSKSYSDIWTFVDANDRDTYYENDGTLLDIYSENPDGVDPYNYTPGSKRCGSQSAEGDCYNREHSMPASWFNDASPMYTDIHHLFPTDGRVNGFRGSLPFGEVGTPNFTSLNGSKRGSALSGLGYSGTVFEPIDEFKGDIARAYFYMATRYENVVSGWSSDMLDGSSAQVFEDWALDMLIQWHLDDPVSTKEENRNDDIETFQGNRNPFVDHPEWVSEIWGDGTTPVITLSESSFSFGNVEAGMNSSSESYSVSGANLEADVSVSVSAPFEISLNNSSWSTSVTVSEANAEAGSNNTVYVRFSPTTANSQSYNQSISHSSAGASSVSLTVSGTEGTGSSSGGADLFISEYLEGSSNNKALEIFNGTGSSVDLSEYSLERYNNGSSTASFTFTPSGTLANNEVYVIGNSSAVQAILNESDVTNDLTFFNGDDAVALLKNGVIIDLIGVIGTDPGSAWTNGSHSTGEKTLVRKSTITQGNTDGFDPITNLSSEWDVYDQDETSYLGSHTFSPPAVAFIWDGSTSSDWSNASNWEGNVVPEFEDNVTIPNIGTSPIVSGDFGVNDLEIASGAILTVNSGASLAIYGAVSGVGQLSVKRNTTGNKGYSIIGSPVTGPTIEGLSADYFKDYNGTDFIDASGAMIPGEGYFIGFDAASPEVILTGTPVSGNVTRAVTSGNYHLVANPYSAAISIEDFISENSSIISGSVYFWDDGGSNVGAQRGGDYIATNGLGVAGTSTATLSDGVNGITGSTAAENGHIPSVQGVFVQASTSGNVTFKPEMQVIEASANSDANHYRATDFQKIKLAIAGKEVYNDILIGLGEGATLNDDYGLDAEKLSGNDCISFYSLQNENKYAIQAIPVVDFESRLKLGFYVSEEGNYDFKVQNIENFPAEISIGLFDKETGKSFDLKESGSFSFGSEAGTFEDRFEILFTKGAILGLNDPMTSLSVQGSSNELTIEYASNKKEEIKLYTMDGKLTHSQLVKFRNNKAVVEVSLAENKMYILQMKNQFLKFIIE